MSEKLKQLQEQQCEQNKKDILSIKAILQELVKMQEELDDNKRMKVDRLKNIVSDLCYAFSQIYVQLLRSKCTASEVNQIMGLIDEDIYDPAKCPPVIDSFYM